MTYREITTNEVKVYLSQAYYLQKSIDAKLDKICQLREQVEKITPVLKSDVVDGSKINSGFADTVNEILDLQFQLSTDWYKQIKVLGDIRKRISDMAKEDSKLALVLELRYVNSLTFEQISCDLELTWRHTHRTHGNALEKFKKFMPIPKMS